MPLSDALLAREPQTFASVTRNRFRPELINVQPGYYLVGLFH